MMTYLQYEIFSTIIDRKQHSLYYNRSKCFLKNLNKFSFIDLDFMLENNWIEISDEYVVATSKGFSQYRLQGGEVYLRK